MKENDWIVANINNPTFNETDFKNILGLTLDNTLLLPLDSYLKSSFITNNDLFKDDEGNFDKTKFEDFYKIQAGKFKNFLETSDIGSYEFGFWDIYQKPNSKVRNPNFNLETTLNPEHVSTGVVGPNMKGERTKSAFELAEKLLIFDWKTNSFKKETPEDYALFKNPIKFISNIFSNPLVLAEYEQDEVDPITGEQHYKGDKKLNDKGEYYFETLGGRSIVGKKVLSLGDILTKEDSLINKYDFFDSDDLEKSIPGVIAKNLTAVAPVIFLGPAGTAWYSGFYVAREIAKSIPMLNNILLMWNEDYNDPKLLNTIAGIGLKLTGGTTEHSKTSTFSFENFGNLVADVALLWSLQKLLANSIAKIKNNTNTIIEAAETKAALEYEKRAQEIWNRAINGLQIAAFRYTGAKSFDDIKDAIASGVWKQSSVGAAALQKFIPEALKAFSKLALLGLDLSLIYMSMISNYDVYNDAIEHGATKNEAAAIALGSMLGMFAVDKYAHLGEIFFDETPEKMALRSLRQGIRDEALEISERIGSKLAAKDTSKEGLLGLIKKSAEKSSNFIKNYLSGLKNHTLGFFGKAFGEGLEETAEELNTDLWKSLYQLAGLFGWVSLTDIGAWDNAFDRYAMSFLGGAVGGGLFYGVDAIKNPKSASDLNTLKELLYLVSLGKTKDILDNLNDLKEKGKLASTNLSIDTTEDSDGNKIFITADENHLSLNDYVYQIMKNSILQMDSILNEHGLKLSDDLLFEKMVLRNLRYMVLKDSLFDKSYITLYYDDFLQIVSDIFNIEKQISDLKENTNDENKREENSNYLEKLKNLESLKKDLLQRKESFLKGEYNLDYVDKMLFYIHPEVSGLFYSTLYEQWVLEKYRKDVSELSESEAKKYSKEWENLKKTKGKLFLNEAFSIYKNTRTNLEKGLLEIKNENPLKWGELLKQLRETAPEKQGLLENSRIPSKKINIDDFLKSIGIIKTDEYDKPWKADPSKVNKAFQLLLAEESSAAFEIVKDHEDGYWSVHFKTPRTLTQELKLRLFLAAAIVIPEGDKLSTWGELTKGGISGINRFGQLDFLGGIEFELVGTRKVKARNIKEKLVDSEDTNPLEVGDTIEIYTEEGNKQDNSTFKVVNVNSDDDRYDFENITTGAKLTLVKSDVDKLVGIKYKKQVSTSEEFLSDIEIPIWKRSLTGESEEDYRDRNTQREGETKEAFEARKKARINKINLYNLDNYIKSIKKFLAVNDIIDRGTYRQLIAYLGARRSDILSYIIKKAALKPEGLVTAENKREFNRILKESLEKLLPDLSNRDEIVQEILSKTRSLREEEFELANSYRKIVLDESRLPDEVYPEPFIYLDTVSFDDIVNALNLYWKDLKISISNNLTPELKLEFPVTLEEAKELLYIMLNGEYSVLLNLAIENAVRVHNLGLDSTTDHSDEIKNIKSEMEKLNYVKLNSDGTKTVEDYLFLNIENGDFYGLEKEETLSILDKNLEKSLNALIDEIGSNEDLSTMNELHKKATIDLNPIVKVMKAVLPKLGEDFNDVEDTLESIYLQFESLEIPTSFTLSSKQINALNKARKYFRYILGVILAAKTKSSYFDFLPYNNSLNEFIKENKDVIKDVKELLELDENLANVIEESFEHFDKEISTWISRSQNGTVNKREMFSKFDLRFNKARLDFFNQIKDSCKLNAEKDLFKGFEHIDVDKPDAIVEIEKLIYNNFKLLNWSILDFISIIQKLVVPKKVVNLDSGLNKSLDSEFVLTDYDKFVLLISLVASDPIDFYEFYKGYVLTSKGKDGQKIAPLTFLEYNIRLGYVHKNSKEFINSVLEEFASLNDIKLNILKNTFIIGGIAGVGKTDIVVRALQESDLVWVSGPSDTLIEGLKKIIPHALEMGHKDLLNAILGSDLYSQILSEVSEATDKAKKRELYDGKHVIVDKNSPYPRLKDSIKFVTKDAPKLLVIDEITLFSNTELLLLSKWSELTGCELVYAGDKHQNGDDSIGFNIKEDCVFAFRAPEMKISLRDANIWKYKNQLDIVQLLDELDKYSDNKTSRDESVSRTKKYLNNFNFHYYLNDDNFTGELVTEKLEDNVIQTLKGSIAFIGDTSSLAYLKLKGTGKNIEVFDSIEKILGKEFDYVISDIDLEYKPVEGYSEYYNITRYLNTLYTLITRSKNGTILIDNGLTKTIKGSVVEQYSNNNIGINPEVTELYVTDKMNFLNSLNLNRIVPLEPKEEPLTEDTIIEGEEYEEPEPEPVEDEPETEDDSYLDIEAKQGAIIPIYGNMNFSGLIRDPETKKLHKGEDNRDLGIFLSDGEEIEVKDRPLKSLFLLKSLILFDKLEDEDFDLYYNQCGYLITDLFTAEELQSIKYYVLAEDYNPETHKFITREAGYEDGKLIFSINGIEKVFTLIGVIEKNGKEYQITLGGLSNPETLRKNAKDAVSKDGRQIKGTITRIQERAAATTDPELKLKLLEYANSYNDKVDNYEALLKYLLTDKWSIGEGKNRWQIKKPSFDRCTRISRLKNEDGTTKYVPIGTNFDTNTSQYVVSPIYTQVNENGKEYLFPGLDSKHKGKPVIFVSSFALYNPTELRSIYEKQKAKSKIDPKNSYPEVRKIILDPRGVDFEDLVNMNVLVDDKSKIRFPFSNTATAFRMYMSLWNFRARITKFNDLVKKYLDDNKITPTLIELLAMEESQNPKSTDEKFKPLRDLNEYLKENNVELFRLGYSAKNGVYSRKIDDKTDGTFINYQMALDYLKVIDLLFENVLNKLIPPPSASTVKAIMSKSSSFSRLEEAANTWVRKLASNTEVTLNFKSDTSEDAVAFKVSDLELFKSLPLNLVRICKNISLGLNWSLGFDDFRQLLKDDTSLYSWWYIKLRDTRTNESEYLDYLSIVDGLSGGILDTTKTGAHTPSPGIVAYDEKTGEGNYDRRIINLFKLALHGHVGDGFPADKTLLRFGIFADTFTVGTYDAKKAFTEVSTNRELYRTNAIPSSPVIKADISPWNGKTLEDVKKEEEKTKNSELERVNRILGKNLDSLDLVLVVIQNNINNIFASAVGSRELLNTIVEYLEINGTYTFKTVREIIKEKTGLDVTKLDTNSSESGVEYEFDKYLIVKNGDKLEIKNPAENIVTEDTLKSFVSDLREILSEELLNSIREDLENNDEDTTNFNNYISDLFKGIELKDFKDIFHNFITYIKDNVSNVDIKDLSQLLNRLNKIKC